MYKKALQAALMISICMIIAIFAYQFNINLNIYFLGIGALVTINTNKKESFRSGLERLLGCISGAIFGMISISLYKLIPMIWILPLISFVAVLLVVIVNAKIHNRSGTLEAVIVYTTMLSNLTTNFNVFSYGTLRIIETLCGFIIGLLINRFIFKNVEELV